jgi:16S rRNA (cytosine967-C5)-methyltransferase
MTPAARLQAAVDILGQAAATSQPVERLLRDWGRSHRFAGSKDRAAIAERVFAVLRHRASFAWRMGDESPRALVIASLLEEGGVEALFTGGYGPAPLDDAERARIAQSPQGKPPMAVAGEYPEFLEGELRRAFGDRLLDETIALQARAPIDLRVNTLKADRSDVLDALRAEGYEAEPTPRARHGVRVAFGARGLERTAPFEAGAFEFQDEAAQLAADLCGAEPGMRVLDLAAGAGGKSLALAAAMENRGEIVATDIRAEALAELERRAARAGASIVRAARAAEGPFDLVLLDAPCSGTGTWRRQPELRWRLTPERLAELQRLQDSLLATAAVHVRPGGRLVYATCSILPCENEDRIAAFRESHPAFAAAGEVFRASPLSTGTDGFFAVALRSGQESPNPRP